MAVGRISDIYLRIGLGVLVGHVSMGRSVKYCRTFSGLMQPLHYHVKPRSGPVKHHLYRMTSSPYIFAAPVLMSTSTLTYAVSSLRPIRMPRQADCAASGLIHAAPRVSMVLFIYYLGVLSACAFC
ncbi:uncharacterized protein HD556DRAFT_721344 [Suillus plorans]|uniref:Uncharacterized protein n=1 Tax=Suillus plorans TaxID=116603 RepID=A0A9P7DTR6_9AGAM|nr:uncharacterized protein HD556DRAFT_721344 [Suillus plorans]KAG1802928.1 hypothetical protein HD556DRAFT_721344 [Suillus plorans]